MRPGLTGLWQVSARSDPDVRRRQYLGEKYVREWSLWLDLLILAKTIPVVVRGQGGMVTARPVAEPATGGVGELEPQLIGADAIQPLGGWPMQEFSE